MNTNNSNKVSITDAAKKLGLNRSRLNQIINESGIKKTKSGKVVLVDYNDVQNLIQTLAATGKIRTPKSSQQSKNQLDKTIDIIINELQTIRSERDELKEKLSAAQSEVFELRGTVKALTGKVKELEPQNKIKSKKFKLPFIGQVEISN